MAFIYKRKNSDFWWIRFRDRHGKVHRQSTKFHVGDRQSTREAKIFANQKTADELETAPSSRNDRWECWVHIYLAMRHSKKPKTHIRYALAWKNIEAFFSKKKILFPSRLTYLDCQDYLSFRQKGDRELGVLRGHHNTALFELKLLSMVMNEAVRRGFSATNPALKMGISREAPDEKPDISDEHIHKIRAELASEPEWMSVSFEIGLYTGCRLRATVINLSDVDVDRKRILFHEKGARVFQVPMRDELIPVFKRLIDKGRRTTCDMPAMPSKFWWQFFKRIGLPQYCFHCLRVTFITRAARAGLQERDVMRLVNHASTTIHRVYVRLKAEDLEAPLNKIHFPIADPLRAP